MSVRMIRICGKMHLIEVCAEEVADWNFDGATRARVELPATPENEIEMTRRGFFFADRTLSVSIDLKKCPVDLQKNVRIPIEKVQATDCEILEIAKKSFYCDRRFSVDIKPNPSVVEDVVESWVTELGFVNAAIFRGVPVGFLATEEIGEAHFVKLAAVLEKFRLTGAAVSLYAKAAVEAREAGMKFLDGRISTLNTAVTNLYAFFGARFDSPRDIFLKEF